MIYIAQVIAYTGLLWAIYGMLLRDRPIHGFNRAYLLLATILPFAIPFVTLPQQTYSRVANITDLGVQLPEIVVGQALKPKTETATDWLLVWYAAVALALLVVMAVRWLKLYRVVKRSKAISYEGYTLLLRTGYGPGSWGKYIFLPDDMVEDTIIKHELAHIQLKHTADVIWMNLLQCLCWPNLFLHLLKKELKQLHEYQADVVACNDKTEYQHLLVASLFKTCTLPFTHSFIIHPIKRRIKMLNKKINPNKNRVAAIAAIVLTGALAFNMVALQSCKSKNWEVKQQKDEVLTVADVMPAANYDVMSYLAKEIKYPEQARTAGVQGRILIKFVINETGDIIDATVVKVKVGSDSVDLNKLSETEQLLTNEALRVVKAMPKWVPGEKDGKKVKVFYFLPITFKLEAEDDSKMVTNKSARANVENEKTTASADDAKIESTESQSQLGRNGTRLQITGMNNDKESPREDLIAEAKEVHRKVVAILENDGAIPIHEDGKISVSELDAILEKVTKDKK